MKLYALGIVLLYCALTSVNAQDRAPKWNFGLGIITTKCEFENHEINDHFYPRLRRFGTGIQFSAKYKLNNRLNFDLVFEASNAKLVFLYYGMPFQLEAFMPKFPIRINYSIRIRESVRHDIGLGLVNYLDFYSIGTYYNSGGTELPERSIIDISTGGWHPLAQLHYGILWRTKKERWQQVAFYFNKGFSPITEFTLTRISPPTRVSTFDFLGTYWGFEYTWYLRKSHS